MIVRTILQLLSFSGVALVGYLSIITLLQEPNRWALQKMTIGVPKLPPFYIIKSHAGVRNLTTFTIEELDDLDFFFEPHDVLIHDKGPCYWVVQANLKHNHIITQKSGGEYIWCRSLMNQLMVHQNRRLLVTNDRHVAALIIEKQPILTLHHWGCGDSMSRKWSWDNFLQPTFVNPQCVLKLSYWGVDSLSSPGLMEPRLPSLDRYLVPFDTDRAARNTHTGFGNEFQQCGPADISSSGSISTVLSTLSTADLKVWDLLSQPRPLVVIFGKHWNDSRVHSFFRNASFWRELADKTTIIALMCHEELFRSMAISNALKEIERPGAVSGGGRIIHCLRHDSAFKSPPLYYELLKNATALLGLGQPRNSPSPLEALACNTAVLMPPDQHAFIHAHASSQTPYYPVSHTGAVLAAIDKIVACRTTADPLMSICPSIEGGIGSAMSREFLEGPARVQSVMDRVEKECIEAAVGMRI